MKQSGLFVGALVMSAVVFFAADGAEAIVQMPVMKVPATRLERYTVVETGVPPSDSFRLVLKPGPRAADMLAILVGGVLPGDEIVRIDGKEVAAMRRDEWSRELYGDFKLVLRRSTGRKSFRLIEADGRRAW